MITLGQSFNSSNHVKAVEILKIDLKDYLRQHIAGEVQKIKTLHLNPGKIMTTTRRILGGTNKRTVGKDTMGVIPRTS